MRHNRRSWSGIAGTERGRSTGSGDQTQSMPKRRAGSRGKAITPAQALAQLRQHRVLLGREVRQPDPPGSRLPPAPPDTTSGRCALRQQAISAALARTLSIIGRHRHRRAGSGVLDRKSSTATVRAGLIHADAFSTSTFAAGFPVECRRCRLTLDSWTMSRSMIRSVPIALRASASTASCRPRRRRRPRRAACGTAEPSLPYSRAMPPKRRSGSGQDRRDPAARKRTRTCRPGGRAGTIGEAGDASSGGRGRLQCRVPAQISAAHVDATRARRPAVRAPSAASGVSGFLPGPDHARRYAMRSRRRSRG